MRPTPKLTSKSAPRAVRSQPKCSNEYCKSLSSHTLINGEDEQPFCEDCLKAVVGEMVIENDQCTFYFNLETQTIEVG